jgi:hypothetical protein
LGRIGFPLQVRVRLDFAVAQRVPPFTGTNVAGARHAN